MSAAVFWSLCLLMRSQLEPGRRFLPLLLLTSLIAAIAVSRVQLEFHNAAEVCVGICVGLLSLLLSRFFVLRGRGLALFDAYALALWAVVAVFITHGFHMPGEDVINTLVSHLKGHVVFCENAG
jgi:membrane-associated phospholipid phosphatase